MSDTAFFITYAGIDAANGPYTPTGKKRYGAPVYENDRKCLLSREPHMNSVTRQTSHGWIIGQGGKPLYGVQTESLTPPSSGWMKFGGAFPLPRLETVSAADASLVAAEQFKEHGKGYFADKRYDEAEAKWSRALALPELADKELNIALYANRAEARLRQYKWDGALADAKEALKLNPVHDKALLRAAVACRELKEYPQALDFVQQCLDAHPKHADAKSLFKELEKLLDDENAGLTDNTLKAAKVQDEWLSQQSAAEGEQGILQKAFAAKDTNSKKGFDAFAGYGKTRTGDADAAPAAPLPFHRVGIPEDRVDAVEKSLQAIHEQKEEKKQQAKEAQDMYPRIKQDYKERAAENLKMGKAEPTERIMPTATSKPPTAVEDAAELEAKVMMKALKGAAGEGAPLSTADTDAIDALFAGFATAAPGAVAKAPAGGRKAKLQEAKALVSSGAPSGRGASAAAIFEQLLKKVTGPDGRLVKKQDLDAQGQQLLDVVVKVQKAKTAGQSIDKFESELAQFSQLAFR